MPKTAINVLANTIVNTVHPFTNYEYYTPKRADKFFQPFIDMAERGYQAVQDKAK